MARLDDRQRDALCSRYLEGESSNALGRAFGVSGVAARKVLEKRGISRRPDNSQRLLAVDEEISLCEQYAAGSSAAAVATERGVSAGYVGRLLTRHGYAKRSDSEARRRYRCDHTFFDSIDTEEKAYWLGFIAADGCVVKSESSSPALQVILSSKDGDHLARLAGHLGSDHPVRNGTGRALNGRPIPTSRLFIRSEQLTQGLARHGITQAKTWSLRWPDVRDDLSRHFLRGYFDGDGSWLVYANRKKPSPLVQFSLVGNAGFLAGCQGYIMAACGLNRTKLLARDDSDFRRLSYTGNRQCRRIFRLLYGHATVCLPRKRERVADLLA